MHRIDPHLVVECPILPSPRIMRPIYTGRGNATASMFRRRLSLKKVCNLISNWVDLFHYLHDPHRPVIVPIPGLSLAGNPKVGPTDKPCTNENFPRNVRRVFHGTFDAELIKTGVDLPPRGQHRPCGDLGDTETQIWQAGRLMRFLLLIEYPSPALPPFSSLFTTPLFPLFPSFSLLVHLFCLL